MNKLPDPKDIDYLTASLLRPVIQELMTGLNEESKTFSDMAAQQTNQKRAAHCRGICEGFKTIGYALKVFVDNLPVQPPASENFMVDAAKALQAKLPEDWLFLLVAGQQGKFTSPLMVTTIDRIGSTLVAEFIEQKATSAEDWHKL